MSFLQFKSILLFFFVIKVQEASKDSSWLNGLIHQIKNDTKTSEVLILINDCTDDHKDLRLNKIVRGITENRPSKLINFLQVEPKSIRPTGESQNLHERTTFVAILVESTSPKSIIEFLTKVSHDQSHPRLLIIILLDEENSSYEELLRYAWSKKFLDFTILEVVKKNDSDQKLFWNLGSISEKSIAVMHYFNPFTKIYTRKKFSSEAPIFPEKLKNLNGIEMKAGTTDLQPMVRVERNLSGYILEVSGPEAMTVKILSQVMNFKVLEIPFKEESFGNYNCNKSRTTGLPKKVVKGEIQFITNNVLFGTRCAEHSCTYIIRRDIDSYVPVVPNIVKKVSSLSVTSSSFYSGILTCVMVTLMWLILHFLKFDERFWCPLHIVAALFGHPIPRDVARHSDRIALSFILIGFWFFSSTFYSILTDIKLITKTEKTINNLSDLVTSNLKPFMVENIRNSLLSLENDEVMQILLKESKIIRSDEDCIQLLLKLRNFSCVINEQFARMVVQKNLDENHRPLLKILKESFLHNLKIMVCEPNSPYLWEFDRRLKGIDQSGVIGRWNQIPLPYLMNNLRVYNEEERSTDKMLLIPLLVILAAGYGISLLVFVGELLINYIENLIYHQISLC